MQKLNQPFSAIQEPLNEKGKANINIISKRTSKILISISIILGVFSLFDSNMKIGSLGLIDGMNPCYFFAIGLLIISFFITIRYNPRHICLILIHVLCLDLLFVLVPVVVEGAPRFTYNYVTSSHINFIVQNGHSDHSLIPYQSWPGIFYLGSMLNLIGGISSIEIIFYTPILFSFLNLPLSYLLYSSLLEDKREVWGCFLLGFVFFWGAPICFVPGVLGGALASYAIVGFIRWRILERRDNPSYGFIILLFAIGCVISHLLSSITLLITLLFLCVIELFYKKEPKSITIVLFLFVIIISWQFYVVGSYSFSVLRNFLENMLRYDVTTSEIYRMGFSGSHEHSQVVMIRIVTAIVLVFLGFIGFLKCIGRKRFSTKSAVIAALITAPTSMVFLTSYSGEILSRAFSGSATPLRIFASKNLIGNIFPWFLLVLFLSFPVFSFINAYGNEASDYVARSEIYGVSFLSKTATANSNVYTFRPRIWGFNYQQTITRIALDPENFVFDEKTKNFILMAERDIEDYKFLVGEVDLQKIHSFVDKNSTAKMYMSNNFALFFNAT